MAILAGNIVHVLVVGLKTSTEPEKTKISELAKNIKRTLN